MSATILYNGHRNTVKINENSLVQDVLNDAALKFSVDGNAAILSFKRTVLNNSMLFRFCGVPQNALIDMTLKTNQSKTSSTGIVKIALSTPSNGSIIQSVPCNINFHEMLSQLIADNKLPASTLELEPEIIYMRNSYSGGALSTTTLGSLGLQG